MKFIEADDKWFESKDKRQDAIKLADEIQNAAKCFENNERFLDDSVTDPSQWQISAMATYVHVILPLAFMIPLWLVILIRKKRADKDSRYPESLPDWIFRLISVFYVMPWYPINKLVNTFLKIKIHINERSKREATEFEKKREGKDDDYYIQQYKKKKESLNNEIDNNTRLGKFM